MEINSQTKFLSQEDIKSYLVTVFFGFSVPFSIYANNSGEIRLSQLLLPFIIIAILNVIILLAIKLLRGNYRPLALIVSMGWILFFQTANIYNVTQSSGFRIRYLLIILLIIIVVAFYLYRKISGNTYNIITNFFLITSTIMYIQPTISLFGGIKEEVFSVWQELEKDDDLKYSAQAQSDSLPDIYYIILDGYGGNEVLSEYFEFDNEPFYNMLEKKGFVISYNSRSNYTSTPFSLSSSLNMYYLDTLTNIYGEEFKSIIPLYETIFNSNTFKSFKSMGYHIAMVTSSSYFNPVSSLGLLNEFKTFMKYNQYLLALYSNSPLPIIKKHFNLSWYFLFEIDADGKPWVPESINWTLERGYDYINNGRSDFVFQYILCPHEPYYFDKMGEIKPSYKSDKWNNFDRDLNEYKVAYGDNLMGLNIIVEAFLDSLIGSCDEMPIIILQSDHGPPEINVISLEQDNVDVIMWRTSILNAFLVPEEYKDSFTDGMSPVNTFRILIGKLTSTDYKLLENRAYYSFYRQPYKYQLILTN